MSQRQELIKELADYIEDFRDGRNDGGGTCVALADFILARDKSREIQAEKENIILNERLVELRKVFKHLEEREKESIKRVVEPLRKLRHSYVCKPIDDVEMAIYKSLAIADEIMKG